jgi:hypothetical protein
MVRQHFFKNHQLDAYSGEFNGGFQRKITQVKILNSMFVSTRAVPKEYFKISRELLSEIMQHHCTFSVLSECNTFEDTS